MLKERVISLRELKVYWLKLGCPFQYGIQMINYLTAGLNNKSDQLVRSIAAFNYWKINC